MDVDYVLIEHLRVTRYRNYEDEHAWLVECSSPALVDLVRQVLGAENVTAADQTAHETAPLDTETAPLDRRRTREPPPRSGPRFEVPPPSFHHLIGARR